MMICEPLNIARATTAGARAIGGMRRRGPALLLCFLLTLLACAVSAQVINLTDVPVLVNAETQMRTPPDKGDSPWLFLHTPADARPLTLGDKSYATGLYAIHGTLSWSYALDGKYCSLVSDLGENEGAASIKVQGDGKLLYDSGRLPLRDHITAMIDVRGVRALQVSVVDTVAPVPWNDKVVFGNPQLITRPVPEVTDTPVLAARRPRTRNCSRRR